jgi:ArsR family transcriptional regulator
MAENMNLIMNDFVAITKALSDTNRVRALLALRKGELCVCQIIELLGLAPSTISKHMSILKQAGLVDSRKDSRWVYYRLSHDNHSDRCIRMITDLSITLLEHDAQVDNDDIAMEKITSVGLDTLCKSHRSMPD